MYFQCFNQYQEMLGTGITNSYKDCNFNVYMIAGVKKYTKKLSILTLGFCTSSIGCFVFLIMQQNLQKTIKYLWGDFMETLE